MKMNYKNLGVLSMALMLCMVVIRVQATQSWTQLSPTGNPGARELHTAIYDTTNNIMTIFGGYGPPYRNDVWVLSTANGMGGTPAWTPLSPTGTSPSARHSHTAVYDPTNNLMTIFGGYDGGSFLNDVWVLSTANGLGNSAWTQLSPTGSAPTPRFQHTAVYDTTNNRMTIFGGNYSGGQLNDAWVLSNANGLGGTPAWTQLSPTGSAPTTRYGHSAVYDATNNCMTIFGGTYGATFLNDVWVLSTANGLGGTPAWTQLSPTPDPTYGLPTARYGQTAVYDAANNLMTIFGGYDGSYLNDVWVLSHANGLGGTPAWTQLSPTGPPSARASLTAIYDVANNIMTIYGGWNGGALNEVWVLSPADVPVELSNFTAGNDDMDLPILKP